MAHPEEQAGSRHKGAAQGQHLLFAAGERAAGLADALAQDGEELEDVFHVVRYALLVRAQEGAEVKVFPHREFGENEAAFGNLGDAPLDDLRSRELLDGLSVEENLAAAGMNDAAYGHEGGGLAGAVGPYERDDFAVLDFEGNVPQSLNLAVKGVDTIKLKHRGFLQDRP